MSTKKHSPQPKRSEALSSRLSKSASELSCAPQNQSPPRARSAHHAPLSVVHRTQHFFTNLKSRWHRSKSKERCPAGTMFSLAPADSSGTDYADSSESTPANSPRHRGRMRVTDDDGEVPLSLPVIEPAEDEVSDDRQAQPEVVAVDVHTSGEAV